MPSAAGSIYVDLILRSAQYNDGLKKAKSSTSDFEKGIKDLARSIAPLLGGAGFLAITENALNSAEAINNASKAVGLSAEEFQKLTFAFREANIDSDTFTSAIIKLNNQLAAGKLPYADTNSAILGIAERLKNAKDGIDRTRIASEAFGTKLGAKMIPALVGGRDEIIRLGKEAEELGIILGNDLVQDADTFQREIEKLGEVVTKNFQAGLLSGFVGESKSIKDIYSAPSFRQGIKDIGAAFGELAGFVLNTVTAFREAKIALAALGIEIAKNAHFIDEEVANEALLEAAERMKKIQSPAPPKSGSSGTSAGGNDEGITFEELKKRQDAMNAIFDSLNKQTVLLQIQNDNFGESKEKIDAMVRSRELLFELDSKGIVLSEKEKQIVQDKLDSLATETQLQAELKAAAEERAKAEEAILKQQDEQRKLLEESIQRIKEDLADNLIDAIKGAKSLSQAFKDVAASIAEAVTKAQILNLLSGGKSGGGDLLGALFGGSGGPSNFFSQFWPSYDVGTPFVPQDQMAQLHQGEMVIPKVQAEAIRKGQAGNNIVMNIYAQDASSFARSQSQILAQTQQMLARAQRRNN